MGQQKLVSTLAMAQAQIVELRNSVMEKDRAMVQLRKETQQSVRLVFVLVICVHSLSVLGLGSND